MAFPLAQIIFPELLSGRSHASTEIGNRNNEQVVRIFYVKKLLLINSGGKEQPTVFTWLRKEMPISVNN